MANVINTIIQQEHINALVWNSENSISTSIKRLLYSPSSSKGSSIVVYEQSNSDFLYFIDPAIQSIVDSYFGQRTTRTLWSNLLDSEPAEKREFVTYLSTATDSSGNLLYKKVKTTEDLCRMTMILRESERSNQYLDWSGYDSVYDNLIFPSYGYLLIRKPSVIYANHCYIGFSSCGRRDDVNSTDNSFGNINCNTFTYNMDWYIHPGAANMYYPKGSLYVNPGGNIVLTKSQFTATSENVFDRNTNELVESVITYLGIGDNLIDCTDLAKDIIDGSYNGILTIKIPATQYEILQQQSPFYDEVFEKNCYLKYQSKIMLFRTMFTMTRFPGGVQEVVNAKLDAKFNAYDAAFEDVNETQAYKDAETMFEEKVRILPITNEDREFYVMDNHIEAFD